MINLYKFLKSADSWFYARIALSSLVILFGSSIAGSLTTAYPIIQYVIVSVVCGTLLVGMTAAIIALWKYED